MDKSWENHYQRKKSILAYPDENLVRMIKKNFGDNPEKGLRALDLGCGSGRHVRLLHELGIADVTGSDISEKGLLVTRENYGSNIVQNDNRDIPFRENTFDIIVAWGSLHYNNKSEISGMLDEIKRVLKKNGMLFATMRCSRDTHLKKGKHLGNDVWITELNDISGSIASFYSEDEIKKYFSIFEKFEYGLVERTIIGDTKSLVSHWVLQAVK